MTSDAFFTREAKGRVFDIIYIDGLHTFEQTFRDFCASLSHSHSGTVWIIDDVIPIDVFSALGSIADAKRFRAQSGAPMHGGWHGDVYKLVFAIHDFFPQFSFMTINTAGNPQTIVWYAPRADFAPRFDNFETISRLSYFDLRDAEDLLNLIDEATAMDRLERIFADSSLP